MRIIEESAEHIITCPECNTTIGYFDEDEYTTIEGTVINCPKCNAEMFTQKFAHLLPFPDAYFHFGNGKEISDGEINKWVKCGLKNILDKNLESWDTGTGNARVSITAYEDEIDIDVSKNYWEASINREEALKIVNN